MFYPLPPPDGAYVLSAYETPTLPTLSRRRRARITRKVSKLREVHLPARLAAAQERPHDGRASAAYLRGLGELWELEGILATAPAPHEL